MAVKKTAKKSAKKASAAIKKSPAIQQKYTKTAILNEIATKTDLSKKQVSAVLDELAVVIERHIKKRAVGEFTLPGLLKIKAVKQQFRRLQGIHCAARNPEPNRRGFFLSAAA